jgi:CubicO group peptidase (beta-lactamase class C family)
METKPVDPPGSRFVYSDINFETLGLLVEAVSGMSLNEYAVKKIFVPLRMRRTGFLPPPEWLPDIAPTEYDENGKMLRGVVHDPTARRMGGVAGHAGLFSTADDLAKFAQQLLTGHTILSRMAIEKMSTPQQAATAASRGGWGGTSIRRLRATGESCCRWDLLGTPALQEHRSGSIQRRTRTSFY